MYEYGCIYATTCLHLATHQSMPAATCQARSENARKRKLLLEKRLKELKVSEWGGGAIVCVCSCV